MGVAPWDLLAQPDWLIWQNRALAVEPIEAEFDTQPPFRYLRPSM